MTKVYTAVSCPALLGADVVVGPLWLGNIVSPALSELFVELMVFADVDVMDPF